MTVKAPTFDDLREHGASLRLKMSDAELTDCMGLLEPNLDVYRSVDAMPDEVLAPRYPRDAGYTPAIEVNPLNAWAVKVEIRGAPAGPLAGRTVVLKDNICLAGVQMLNGTRALEGFRPQSDATIVTRILDAGATIVGKAHCEYLCGSGGSHTSASGPVRNPHKPSHMAGGSSSGCAVLVANGEADFAIGGDQGGSIRVPASFSGAVGMKPTHGLVPYTGIATVDPMLDHAGPMTANVADNALMLSVIAGADGLDPRQYAPAVGDYLAQLDAGVAGMRIGVVGEGFGLPSSEPDVDAIVRGAARDLASLGAVVEDVSIPMHDIGRAIWLPITIEGALRTLCHGGNGRPSGAKGFYPVDLLEAFAERSRVFEEMPINLKMMLLLAEHMHTRYDGRFYVKAHNILRRVVAAYNDILSRYDVLVMPTTPMKATPIPASDAPAALVVQRAYEPLINTGVFDVTGHPSLSLPCGVSDGLPVGFMITGRYFDEAKIYRVARALEAHLALDLRPTTVKAS